MLATFLYPAPPPSYTAESFPNELLWIPCTDAGREFESVPAVLLQCPAARYLVLYLHTNGEDLGLCYSFGCGLRSVLEVHVLLVEYPGYGICPGKSSEESLWRVAIAAFQFCSHVLRWPAEDVIVMGRSLGGALATRLASNFLCHGIILVAPFLSLVDAVSHHVGVLARVLVGDCFCNRVRMQDVRVPTLIIHGVLDTLVPWRQGQELFENCPHDKKLFVSPELMDHNCDLLSDPDFLIRPMLRFFALPDYCFVDLTIPPDLFDNRPKFHRIVEMAKDDVPLCQAMGDQEAYPSSPTMQGPQGWLLDTLTAGGDVDDLDWPNEWTVRTPGPGTTASESTNTPAHSQDDWQKEDSQSSWSAAKNSDALSMDSLIDDGGVRRPEAHIPFSPGSFSWGINLDDGICRFLDEENTM